MSKRKSPVKSVPTPAAVGIAHPERLRSKTPKPAERPSGHGLSRAAIRETVESVVIAFVLAFLFRTFEAEAFVIPTGSMATTLMGRHKDLECPVCGHEFQVSASAEVTPDGADRGPNVRITSGACPMCRYPVRVGDMRKYPSFKGDRILVGKFAYQFSDPERWDVAVFHFPGKAQINYIKRVVGLPNETVRIRNGDIYVKRQGDSGFTMERKPADKVLAMLQPVYDNDLTPRIKAKGWPVRWSAWPSADGSAAGTWQAIDDDRGFETAGAASESWIRYEHRVPSEQQWLDLPEDGSSPRPDPPEPALISDFAAYNSDYPKFGPFEPTLEEIKSRLPRDEYMDKTALYRWVGDLALKCTLETLSDDGQVILELVKGGKRFQCRIDLRSGDATLSIGGEPTVQVNGADYTFAPTVNTGVRGAGKHDLMFANCDGRLLLWVDGREVEFGKSAEYPPLNDTRPTALDLAPVGVGTLGAAARVSRLVVLRDVHYLTPGASYRAAADRLADGSFDSEGFTQSQLRDWQLVRKSISASAYSDYELGADQFFMLGDNSPQSSDSRVWDAERYVQRDLLIGKAFFIYWPHSWDSPVPFWPNFRRMGFVR